MISCGGQEKIYKNISSFWFVFSFLLVREKVGTFGLGSQDYHGITDLTTSSFLTLQEHIIYIIEKRVMLLVYISTANTSVVLSLSAGVS